MKSKLRFKKLTLALLVVVFTSLMMATAFANGGIGVTIDGVPVEFQGQQPTLVDGRTLVPVRGVFEQLGFNVSWDGVLRQITLTRPSHTVVLTVDQATFTTNGATHTLDVAAQIINGSTMLPIRAVVESVGYELDWDGATNTVLIETNTVETLEATIFEMTNAHRVQNGLAPLVASEELAALARSHARDMVTNNFVSNSSQDGTTSIQRVENAGLDMVHVAANSIRTSHTSAEEAFAQIIVNSGRENVVLGQFVEQMGIAVEIERRPGNAANLIYIVQKTAAPRISDSAEFIQRVFELINAERAANGLNVLEWNATLAQTAQIRANAGRITSTAELAIGRHATANINSTSPQRYVSIFMNNENQRAQVLNPAATSVGIGFYFGSNSEGNPVTHMPVFFAEGNRIPNAASPFLLTNLTDANVYPISQITLPIIRQATSAERADWIAEYNSMGGVTDFEREIVRLVNIERVAYGLNPVAFCETMAMAARYYTQLIIHIGYTTGGSVPGTAHNQGPYGGSGATARSFGANSPGGNAFVPGPVTPQALVDGWMNSPGHRRNILRPAHTRAGAGTSVDSATNRSFNYLLLGQ